MGLDLEDGFNPTLVRLRQKGGRGSRPGGTSFNPTLVRLRLRLNMMKGRARDMFQSHAGSIEALPSCCRRD